MYSRYKPFGSMVDQLKQTPRQRQEHQSEQALAISVRAFAEHSVRVSDRPESDARPSNRGGCRAICDRWRAAARAMFRKPTAGRSRPAKVGVKAAAGRQTAKGSAHRGRHGLFRVGQQVRCDIHTKLNCTAQVEDRHILQVPISCEPAAHPPCANRSNRRADPWLRPSPRSAPSSGWN